MSRPSLRLDSARCIGCLGCMAHCMTRHGWPGGPPLLRVRRLGPVKVKGVPRAEFELEACRHCVQAPCIEACPTGAMQAQGSRVFVEEALCTGCMNCRKACPWRIPVQDPATGKAAKCDLCMDRAERGLLPACVAKCITGALRLG